MKKNYLKAAAGFLASALLLTGCGSSLPDMTKEQEEAIGEYAAMLLLKYDAGNRSRLVELNEIEPEWESLSAETAASQETEPDGEQLHTEPSNTEIEILEEETQAAQGQSLAVAEENTVASLEAAVGLPEGIAIAYQGAQVCQSYPEKTGEKEYFALDAAEGKSLLILSFAIQNQTGADAELDLFEQNARYSVTVNGTVTRNALFTMLEKDLTAYTGTIPAGGSAETVLIVEMEKEALNSLSSVSLKLKNDATIYTIQLQ